MGNGGRDWPAAGYQQHVVSDVVLAYMFQRVAHACFKGRPIGHALWADGACHPLFQCVAQQAEVLAAQFGRFGLKQRLWMYRLDKRMAIVFIQARQQQRFWHMAQALGNALQGLRMAAQGATQHGIKLLAALAPVLPQPHGLRAAAHAQLVIVIRTKRGLAVAHKYEGSHKAWIVGKLRATSCRTGDENPDAIQYCAMLLHKDFAVTFARTLLALLLIPLITLWFISYAFQDVQQQWGASLEKRLSATHDTFTARGREKVPKLSAEEQQEIRDFHALTTVAGLCRNPHPAVAQARAEYCKPFGDLWQFT